MNIEKIYLKLPVFLQELLINIQGYRIRNRRFNSCFNKYLAEYLVSEHSVVDMPQLRRFIVASACMPYWREQFDKYGVNIKAQDLVLEIKKLPILSKQFVKENINNFINKNYIENSFWSSTSGTTGSPLSFPCTYEIENKLWAIWERNRRLHGIPENTWMGWFGGKEIVDISQSKPPYWRTCYPLKQVMFSSYHLNINTVDSYFNKLKKSKIMWIHSYPSQIALFASLVKEKDLGSLPDLKIITLGSESFLEYQEDLIKEVFNCKVIQHYGQGEGVAVINQNIKLGFYPEQNFSLVEFDRVDNMVSQFKIIGTNYNNLAFPLIRYDTGDLAQMDGDGSITSIDGRVEDYVILPNGNKLGRVYNIFKEVSNVKEAQLYQKNKNSITIRVVKGVGFDDEKDTRVLITSAQERLGHDIKINIEFLDSIPRTKNGKLRFVVSEIN